MKCLTALLVLFPVLAHCQASPQEMMMQGLYKIGQAEKVKITTTGSEFRGGRQIDIKVTAAFYYQPESDVVKLEVLSWEDGKLISRQAADGNRLWDFDARANTFSSSDYKDSQGGLYRNWKQRVFHTLRLRTTGCTAFTLRILDDVFGTGLASGSWSPWIPTAQVARMGANIVATAQTPNKNRTLYSFSGNDDVGFTFLGAEYDQEFDKGGLEKIWSTQIETGTLFDDTDFRFIPPKGAKAIAVDSRLGG